MSNLNITPVRYDADRMAMLRQREADVRKERGEIAERMQNRARGSDKSWDAQETTAHAMDQATLRSHEFVLQDLRKDIESMELTRPQTRVQQNAPFHRWLRGEDLDALDRKTFCDPAKATQASVPSPHLFTLPYTPDGYAYATGRPLMAALGASRGDTATGENIVPDDQSHIGRIIEELTYIGGALAACYNFVTADGGDLPMPSQDEAGNEGAVLGNEDSTAATLIMANFARVVFTTRTATSKLFHVTNELIQDASFDLTGFVERQAKRRIGRTMNNVITTNDHDGNPQGVVKTSKLGVTTASGSVAKFSWDDLKDLIYKVDRAYRMGSEGVGDGSMAEGGGMIGYMWSDDAERVARGLKDTQNRPLWLPSIRDGAPPTMQGIPAIVNGHMDSLAANKQGVLYGNFSYYGIRRIGGGDTFYRIQDSATLANNSTGFICFRRFDGRYRIPKASNVVDVVAHLKQAAS